jgi:hypothetical protein
MREAPNSGIFVAVPESDDEVTRIARLWLERHGDEAVPLARDMAAELKESGDDNGADMWLRVISAIEEMRKPRIS